LTPIFGVEFGAPLDGHNKTFIIAVASRALRGASSGGATRQRPPLAGLAMKPEAALLAF
jgi:hypothetical protein